MMKESSFEKKIWFIVILVETALLVIAGIFYKGREAVELTYMQEELVDDSGEAAFYMDRSSECRYLATPEFILRKECIR